MSEEVLRRLVERGDRDRQRQTDQEQSIKATEYIGNGYVRQIGQAPTRSRYLGNAGLVPGELVAPLGHGQQDVITHKKPAPFTIETIEEPVFIEIQTPYLVDLRPFIFNQISTNQGYRLFYYRGDQEIYLGDFRVWNVPVSVSPVLSWVYENEAKPKWKDWVIWVRVADYGPIQLDNEEANQPNPGGVSWIYERRETTIGIKGSGNTVIESRIYVRRINQYNNLNVYASAIGEGPLSYALFDSANYETTVITPEDFLDTYDADNPINDFREDRLQWHPVDLDNDPVAPFPYPSTVNYINADILEVVSESTGKWIKFPHPSAAEHIIGGTTQ